MGYDTERYIGFAVDIGDSEKWVVAWSKFNEQTYSTGLEELLAKDYPLLSVEAYGDSRSDDKAFVAITSSIRKVPSGSLEDTLSKTTDPSSQEKAQLQLFARKYMLESGRWTDWEFVA